MLIFISIWIWKTQSYKISVLVIVQMHNEWLLGLSTNYIWNNIKTKGGAGKHWAMHIKATAQRNSESCNSSWGIRMQFIIYSIK